MIDLALNEYQGNEEGAATSQRGSVASSVSNAPQKRAQLLRLNSIASNASEDQDQDQDQFIDADDPRLTGVRRRNMDDPEDIERACLRQMSYKERRKYHSRSKIEFNITCTFHVSDTVCASLTCASSVQPCSIDRCSSSDSLRR